MWDILASIFPQASVCFKQKYHSIYPNAFTNHKKLFDKLFSEVTARNDTFNARNVVFVSSANTAQAKPEKCRVTFPVNAVNPATSKYVDSRPMVNQCHYSSSFQWRPRQLWIFPPAPQNRTLVIDSDKTFRRLTINFRLLLNGAPVWTSHGGGDRPETGQRRETGEQREIKENGRLGPRAGRRPRRKFCEKCQAKTFLKKTAHGTQLS